MRVRIVLLAVTALTVVAGAGCGDDRPQRAAAAVANPESSWIPGQPALGSLPDYAALLSRAAAEAERRAAARERDLKRIAARKRAERLRERREALRRYLEAKRRAERLYKEALRKAALERRRQQEKLRKARLERARRLRELLEKLRVEPGEECGLPEVEEEFECRPGRLPLKGSS